MERSTIFNSYFDITRGYPICGMVDGKSENQMDENWGYPKKKGNLHIKELMRELI
jgi:uncharacterized lipoprotein YddW (UPF0748 family)